MLNTSLVVYVSVLTRPVHVECMVNCLIFYVELSSQGLTNRMIVSCISKQHMLLYASSYKGGL
jgi:hypothetical protein